MEIIVNGRLCDDLVYRETKKSTIKVIDLLNKIANSEEVPKKIKYHWEYEYRYDEDRNEYCYMNNQNERFDDEWFIIAMLNDEVEIIEEEKENEKPIQELKNKRFTKNQKQIAGKINEVIRAINELKKGK